MAGTYVIYYPPTTTHPYLVVTFLGDRILQATPFESEGRHVAPHGPVFTVPSAHHFMIVAPACSRLRSQLRNCGSAWRAPVGLIEQLGVVAFKGKGE
jgi:hypothetical protein